MVSIAPPNCSIMSQIEDTQLAINRCYRRIEDIEYQLLEGNLSAEKEETLQKELDEITLLLAESEDRLKSLHKHNRQSLYFCLGLVLGIFVLFMLYILIFGNAHTF